MKFDADDQTIIAHFDQSMELYESQKSASSEIVSHNSLMQSEGVDPGTLSICRRLARMQPGKRGVAVALLHRYLQVLASKLDDPTYGAASEEAPEQRAEQAGPVPFGQRKAVA